MNAKQYAIQGMNRKITRYQLKKAEYKVIGEGSSRIVVQYSPTIAIKLAKNKKGFIQNRVELETFLDMNNHYKTNHLAKILDYIKDDNERVVALIVRYYPKKTRKLSRSIIRTLKERLVMFNGLDSGTQCDLYCTSSWRRTKSNKLVCVDYGFNRDTKEYYHMGNLNVRDTTYVETMR